MFRSRSILFPLFILAGAATLGALFGANSASSDSTPSLFADYSRILTAAHAWYAEDVERDTMVFSSIRSMLIHLDPHSYFLSPKEYHSMMQRQQGRFSGLGIMVSKRDGVVMVISPIEGTPAYRLGIRAGDVISHIEGKPTKGLTIDQVVDRLRGPEGSTVKITIRRRGVEKPLNYAIVREVIPETSVRYAHLLRDHIGYVRISEFNRTTAQELKDSLDKLADQDMKMLILDLRGNPGGVLEQAVDVADLFLKPHEMVVYTKGRTPTSYQEFRAPGKNVSYPIPVIILVDAGSASASEIVSGALQDHDRALIVGTDTFGKGLVQSVYELHKKAALALTTAKYFTPSGRCIQRPYGNLFTYFRHGKVDLDTLTKFSTDHGRTVYGGGGIHPDVILPDATLSLFQQHLLARGSYFNFSLDYDKNHDIPKAFSPDDAVFNTFKAYLIKNDVATATECEESWKKADEKRMTRFFLMREIISARYGMEQGFKSVLPEDHQVIQALKHLEESKKLWNTYSNPSKPSPRSSS